MSWRSWGLWLALAAATSGCTVGDHNRNDINRVSREKLEQVLSATTKPAIKSNSRDRILNYAQAREIVTKYGNLPNQNLELYFLPKTNTTVQPAQPAAVEVRRLGCAGFMNQYADELADLEASIPEKSERNRLILGDPDNNFVASRSRENQTSNMCGLLGIDTYNVMGKPNFFVQIDQETGLKGVKENTKYRITIRFEEDSLRTLKKKTDGVFILDTAESAALGLVVAGPYAAAGAALESLIDGLWAGAEGKKVPRDAIVIDKRENISGLSEKSADTYGILRTAKDLGADSVAVVPYQGGVGVLYLRGIEGVMSIRGGVSLITNRAGVNHLFEKLPYKIAGMATRVGYEGFVAEHCRGTDTDTKIIYQPSPDNHGGGRKGEGPGGNGGSSSGRNIGGAGGK